MPTCPHENLACTVNIPRIAGGVLGIDHRADVTIKCVDCGQPFEFVGLPLDPPEAAPNCGWDANGQPEARLPIRPLA